MKKIPLILMGASESASEAPPDGDYLVICHTGYSYMTRYRFRVQNPFPWLGKLYRFEAGECDMIATCSNPTLLAKENNIKQIIFAGLTEYQAAEMTRSFQKADFELEQIAA